MPLESCRELKVRQRGIALVAAVYALCKSFPPQERFGLTSQLQRAAGSIPANIAEGYGRMPRGDYLHHLSVANGSLAEVEMHLAIALRLGFVQREQLQELWHLCQEIGKMLRALVHTLKETEG